MIQFRRYKAGKLLRRAWPMAALAACGVAMGAAAAAADAPSAPSSTTLARKLTTDELQTRAREAQIFVAQQQASTMQQGALLRTADLFGESDEEKAARLAKEQGQDAAIAQANQAISDLEDTVRRMQGQMEQLHHQLDEANAHIDRMQKDFDYKICTMTAQQLGTTPDQNGLPCGGSDTGNPAPTPAPGVTFPAPGSVANAPQHLAPPPGILGQIPSNTPMPIPPPATAANGGAAPATSNRPQFDAAMNLLSKGQYDEARAAFRTFADTNPQDALTPQAVYWVGAIAFVRKDYPGAARAFVEEIKNYGTSARAPESMLKLGQSLIAMNQKSQGCTTLEALPGKYPQASPNVLGQAKAARKAAGCK